MASAHTLTHEAQPQKSVFVVAPSRVNVSDSVPTTSQMLAYRKRQKRDSPQHRGEPLSRQMALGQSSQYRACFTSRPPVFSGRCCRLIGDPSLIPPGTPSRRHRFPRL